MEIRTGNNGSTKRTFWLPFFSGFGLGVEEIACLRLLGWGLKKTGFPECVAEGSRVKSWGLHRQRSKASEIVSQRSRVSPISLRKPRAVASLWAFLCLGFRV